MNNIVSIITPCYNSSKFLKECVNSVLKQTYKKWELILIDDSSSDNSSSIIDHFCKIDSRIKSIFLKNNVGPAESRNIAIKEAKGRYIAFIDSDDIWNHKKLEIQLRFMKEREIPFSFTSYQPVSENREIRHSVIRAPQRMNYKSYLKNTIIGCLTVIIDRKQVGEFCFPNIRSSQDMALWLLILKKGFDAYGLDENLAEYRIVFGSNTGNKLISALGVWKVYREIERLNFFISFWYFMHYSFNAIIKRLR